MWQWAIKVLSPLFLLRATCMAVGDPGCHGLSSMSSSCGRRGNIPRYMRRPSDAQELLLTGCNKQPQLLNSKNNTRCSSSYTSHSRSIHWPSPCHEAEACHSLPPLLFRSLGQNGPMPFISGIPLKRQASRTSNASSVRL